MLGQNPVARELHNFTCTFELTRLKVACFLAEIFSGKSVQASAAYTTAIFVFPFGTERIRSPYSAETKTAPTDSLNRTRQLRISEVKC